jgi:hypothetical protein
VRLILSIAAISLFCAALLLTSFLSPRECGLSSDEVRIAASSQARVAAEPGISSSPAFLKSIGITSAWAALTHDVTSTIAIVDTGVDFNHPVLKPFLLKGKNLIDLRKPPQDDNGHGTAVAGIIAEAAKAGEHSGKPLWKGKLLPVKALDEQGSGNEERLTLGIRYAVEQGADIVVLSLGLRRDAPDLREAVAWAESKGVLLIAASGNDAVLHGTKAAVQYPAAYPTVLAVSGSDGLLPVLKSTSGPEVDLSAAWHVQTLAVGGGTTEMEGTSMGAPQVAAAAAMLKAEHPDWKPSSLREALRRTALKKNPKGWNSNTGYGFLSVDKAVAADTREDWREPNNSKAQAAPFPLGKEVTAAWGSSSDNDWYSIEIPYDGYYSILGDQAQLSLYNDQALVTPAGDPSGGVVGKWHVAKGLYWLKAVKPHDKPSEAQVYHLTSHFAMSPDAREPNDSPALAMTIPSRSQQWTGSFHQPGDEDWAVISLPKDGQLKISVKTDTTRIDPELLVQPAGGTATVADERGDGEGEQLTLQHVKAGKLYIKVRNASSPKPEPVIGTYTVSLEYITQYVDPNEPNEGPLAATPLSSDKVYTGLLPSEKDRDWFRLTISSKQKVQLRVGNLPRTAVTSLVLRDKKLQTLKKWRNTQGGTSIQAESVLPPGTYYVTLMADGPLKNQSYLLEMRTGSPTVVFTGFSVLWTGLEQQSIAKLRHTDISPQMWAYESILLAGGKNALLFLTATDVTMLSYACQWLAEIPADHRVSSSVKSLNQAAGLSGHSDAIHPHSSFDPAEIGVRLAQLLRGRNG